MSPRAKGCLLALVILALGWFVLDGSTTRARVVRSRLTIVIATPEGERSGSSVTDDPITTGIETRLPWLKSSKYTERLFPNPTHQPPPDLNRARRLTYDSFRMLPR